MTDKVVKKVEFKKRLDWMDKKLRRDTAKKLGVDPGSWAAWFATPLGRYCPHTGRHLAASEYYKITRYNDGTSRIEIVHGPKKLHAPLV